MFYLLRSMEVNEREYVSKEYFNLRVCSVKIRQCTSHGVYG